MIPLVVIPCLLFSLVESLNILPAHLSHIPRRVRPGPWRRFQSHFANGLKRFVQAVYGPVLAAALRGRYLTASVGVGAMIVDGRPGAVGPAGVPLHAVDRGPDDLGVGDDAAGRPGGGDGVRAVAKPEAGAGRLRERLLEETGRDYFVHLLAAVGDQPMASRGGGPAGPGPGMASSNVGEVAIELLPTHQRIYSSEQLGLLWRDATGPIPEAAEVNFTLSVMNAGSDIDVQLAGPDLDRLQAAGEEVKERLREYAGVYEVADSFRAGKEEMKLGIKPAAEALGLTLQDLGRQVRQAFYGEEAQRIQRGRDDIRVMVRYPRDERRSLGDLENMRIRTPEGGEVPFSQTAVVEPGRGFASIRRVNRNRAVNVTASVDASVTTAGAVIADLNTRILPEVLAGYPGVFYTFEGVMTEQRDAVGGLQRGFVLALLMIVRTARDAVDEVFVTGDAGAVVEATGRDGRGRLLLRISSSLPTRRTQGIAAAAHALSGEICDQCGGPGDPRVVCGRGRDPTLRTPTRIRLPPFGRRRGNHGLARRRAASEHHAVESRGASSRATRLRSAGCARVGRAASRKNWPSLEAVRPGAPRRRPSVAPPGPRRRGPKARSNASPSTCQRAMRMVRLAQSAKWRTATRRCPSCAANSASGR